MPWCATCEGFHAVTRVACARPSRADLLARAEKAEASLARVTLAAEALLEELDDVSAVAEDLEAYMTRLRDALTVKP